MRRAVAMLIERASKSESSERAARPSTTFLFAEQHRLVVGGRNRVSPAVAELAIDGDAVIVLVGVFLLLWLQMLLLPVVVVAPCGKSDDVSKNGGRGRRAVAHRVDVPQHASADDWPRA
jgi:hypothetical protein